MKNTLPILFLFLAILGCNRGGQRAERTDALQKTIGSKFDFSDAVKNKIGKFPAKWNGINISQISQTMIVAYLEYQQAPSGLPEIESDSKRVTQAVVDTLIAKGWNPREQRTMVFVHAQKPEAGSTGTNLIRQYGKAIYNFNYDTINFEPK